MVRPLSILALWSLRDFAFAHVAWLLLLLPATLLIPGMPAATLAFLRTTIGKILVAMLLAGTLGWEARASLDRGASTRAALSAAERRAAEAERQALAARDEARAADIREAASEADAHKLEDEVDAYARDLDQAARRAPKQDSGCRLGKRDARRLRDVGGGR